MIVYIFCLIDKIIIIIYNYNYIINSVYVLYRRDHR